MRAPPEKQSTQLLPTPRSPAPTPRSPAPTLGALPPPRGAGPRPAAFPEAFQATQPRSQCNNRAQSSPSNPDPRRSLTPHVWQPDFQVFPK